MTAARKLLIGVASAAVVAAALVDIAVRLYVRKLRRTARGGSLTLAFPSERTHTIATPDGAALHVAECGAGRPIVLLHGWGINIAYWGPLAEVLRDRGFRVVAVSQRGSRPSSAVTPGVGLPTLASDVETVLDQLDLRDAVLVGQSMGGLVTQAAAALDRHGGARRVGAIVIMNSTAQLAASRGRLLTAMLSDTALATVLGGHPRYGLVLTMGAFGRATPHDVVEAARRAAAGEPHEHRRGLARAMLGADLRSGLQEIDVPTLVLAGGADRVFPLADAEAIVAAIPGARLRVFPDAGHTLMLEHPYEVGDEIARFAGAAVASA